MLTTIETIFSALGGPTAIAREIDVPVQTVHSWKANGSIPRWRRPALLEMANGKEMSAEAIAYLGGVKIAPSAPTDQAEAA